MKTNRELINFLQADNLLKTQLVFDGNILQLYHNQIELDNGQRVERELIHHNPAAAILVTNNEDQVLLVSQPRAAIDQVIFEIPAGILDFKDHSYELPLDGAKRELEEETNYQALTWDFLGKFYVSPGYLNEAIYIYHAQNLELVENPLAADEDEEISLHYFTKAEVSELMQKGEIIDLKTAYALNYWLNLD
ncbi:NUDIX hydrolase [Hutsoniella sourekii]